MGWAGTEKPQDFINMKPSERLRWIVDKMVADKEERTAMIDEKQRLVNVVVPADVFDNDHVTMDGVVDTYRGSHDIIQETGVNIMGRTQLRSKETATDSVNWLGIEPTGSISFALEEIVRGEIQCWRLGKTVVYITRTGTTASHGSEAKPLKVTTWTNSELIHRETFDTIEEAQADWHDQIRQVSVQLATDVLVKP